jgi:2,4-dienoyl-CoA reductase (NADPH2)
LQDALVAAGCSVHLIGGADKAVELDAKHAIKQGTELALSLGNAKPDSTPASPASPAGLQLLPAVAESLALWHSMLVKEDMGELGSILHPKAVFRSPVAHTPYATAPVVQLFLAAASQVFEDFVYHRELAGADGTSVMLEFSAKVNGKALKGIDLIQFDAEGLIVDFEVMVRPMSGLQALADEMGKRMAAYMTTFKAPQ